MKVLDTFPASERAPRFNYAELFDGTARLLESGEDFAEGDIKKVGNSIRFAAHRRGKIVKVHRHGDGLAVQSLGDRPRPSAKKAAGKKSDA